MMRHGNFGRPGPMGNFRGAQQGNFQGGMPNQGNFNRSQGNFGRFQNQGGNFQNQGGNFNQRPNQGNRFQGNRNMNRNDSPRKPNNVTPTKPNKPEDSKSVTASKTPVQTTPKAQDKKEQVTPKQTSNSTTPVKKEDAKPAINNGNAKTTPSPQAAKQTQQKQQPPQKPQPNQLKTNQPQQKQSQPPQKPNQPPQKQNQPPQKQNQPPQKQNQPPPKQNQPPPKQNPQQQQKPPTPQKQEQQEPVKPQFQKPLNVNDRQQNQKQDRSNFQKQRQWGNRSRDNSFSRGDNPEHKEEKKFTGRCRLFVGNLTPDVTEDDFKTMFEQYGEVSEAYVNTGRGFGFIRMDYRHNAEAAKAALDGLQKKGRQLRVRFATHGAALKVKNIHGFASNELLENAFAQFGDLERAIVIVDDRGKPTGDGIVEFVRKPGAQQALRRINDGIFLLGSSPRPIVVEPLEQRDEDDGMPEKFVNKNEGYKKEREKEPRFAIPGSFEHEFAQRWRQIDEMEKERIERVKKDMDEARVRLEDEMQGALIEYQAEQIRKDLLRQQKELQRLEEMRQQDQLRRRHDLELRQREEECMRAEEDRRMQEIINRHGGGPMDQGMQRRDEMMGNMRDGPRGMKDGAPPLPPPPAPPAGMGLDRSGRPNQMQGNMSGNFNSGMGGNQGGNMGGPGGNMGGPGGNMGGGMRQSRFDQGGNFDGGFQSGGGMGNNMGGNMSGGPGGPGNMFGGQGMGGGNMGGGGGPGMRGGDRMDRRREGGPRDDYGDIKRRRY